MNSRIPSNTALLQHSWVFIEWSQYCLQASRPVYPLFWMWQKAHDEHFTVSLAISQSVSCHTPTSLNWISPRIDNSTRSIRFMLHVVLSLKDCDGLIWPMIVTMQKWFIIFTLLIQDLSIPCSCSTIVGELCIIAIMISCIWDQTSVNIQFYNINCYYDTSTKPRIKQHTKDNLNPISDTIPNLQVTLQPLQMYFHLLIPYSQCLWFWWCWWCQCCCSCCCCRGWDGCCWRWQTRP